MYLKALLCPLLRNKETEMLGMLGETLPCPVLRGEAVGGPQGASLFTAYNKGRRRWERLFLDTNHNKKTREARGMHTEAFLF